MSSDEIKENMPKDRKIEIESILIEWQGIRKDMSRLTKRKEQLRERLTELFTPFVPQDVKYHPAVYYESETVPLRLVFETDLVRSDVKGPRYKTRVHPTRVGE
jgi:hypothetical protein